MATVEYLELEEVRELKSKNEYLDEEVRELKKKNNDLVQKIQHWKMLAGQRENEKTDLMKEMNELRLQLSRMRSNGNVQANKLDTALQSAAQKALAHLVRASGEITTSLEVVKAYKRNREQLETESPRWSSMGGTPATANKDKVHRVPPLMIGGQSIQPVVALTMMDTSNARSAVRSSNANRNAASTTRPLPMHMLQDVYIPLTRIDLNSHNQNMETDDGNNANDSSELLQLEENDEGEAEGSQRMEEDFEPSRILDAVVEEEDEPDNEETPPRIQIENPLEGPSWLLDASNQPNASKPRVNLEPDSTTELDDYKGSPPIQRNKTEGTAKLLVPTARPSREFSPTVRRRKRTSSPPPATSTPRPAHYSPRSPARRLSNSGRVLKVLVAKMRLDTEGEAGGGAGAGAGGTPPKRAALGASHAPSPNGATVAGVIVEENNRGDPSFAAALAAGEPAHHRHRQRHNLYNSTDIEILEEHRVNIDRRTKSRDRIQVELQQSHSRERTISGEIISKERTFSREELNNHERTNSFERTDNRERTDPQEQIKTQRPDKVERHKHTHKDKKRQNDVEMENSLESTDNRERTDSQEQIKTQRPDKVERHKHTHKDKKRQNDVEMENSVERTDNRERTDQEQIETQRPDKIQRHKTHKDKKRQNDVEMENSLEMNNIRERTDQEQIETQRPDKVERHKHTHKDKKRQNDVEMEVQQSEHIQRSNSRERKNAEMNMQMEFDRKEEIKDKKERREERTDRHKPSHSRERSNEICDVRTESRASDDMNQAGTSGSASGVRARAGSCDSDSESGGEREGGRPRRPRKPVIYKEKPLNRKMRR